MTSNLPGEVQPQNSTEQVRRALIGETTSGLKIAMMDMEDLFKELLEVAQNSLS